MSGIVGILNVDGAPVNHEILSAMTMFMAFRGPDAHQVWCAGNAGFGHTLLRTARESEREEQPASFDGRVWITSDARIDGRVELVGKLRAKGRDALTTRPDVELILHAYHVWGQGCVEHLLGDFAFAIWDGNERRLFCARDHIGMKPFYYAHTDNTLVFSNTLDCLRLLPWVSDKLNDLAICDFLLLDSCSDLTSTAFADISRLPPAHTLEFGSGAISIRRYWILPEAKPVRYKRADECLEQFCEVFDAATSDRLRGDNAGLLLSGGLDSPTVAASARRVLDKRGTDFDLRAYTHVFDRLIPHEERRYSGQVAKALRIPIQYAVADDCKLYDHYENPEYRTPEPLHLPMGFANADPYTDLAANSRVALTGYGGDPTLASLLSAHVRRMMKSKRYGRLVADAVEFMMADGRFSRLYVRKRWRRFFGPKDSGVEYPGWLNPDMEKRFGLREQWNKGESAINPNHSARPEAYEAVSDPAWVANFEPFDPGGTRVNVEAYHPFFDLRVVQFLMALPVLPWCSDKEILRRAARGVLPDAVRLRPKSPLIMDPIVALLQQPESAWVDSFEVATILRAYVRIDKITPVFREQDSWRAWMRLRPLSLNFWLQRMNAGHYKTRVGGFPETKIREVSQESV